MVSIHARARATTLTHPRRRASYVVSIHARARATTHGGDGPGGGDGVSIHARARATTAGAQTTCAPVTYNSPDADPAIPACADPGFAVPCA